MKTLSNGCESIVVACYSAAGLTFGTVTAGVGFPVAAIACNVGFKKFLTWALHRVHLIH